MEELLIEEKLLQKIERSLKNLRMADLELFITAAQMKNLGKSASFHHLSQSAASAVIQRVESSFGISLCTHEKRAFRLTPEGLALLPRLEDWMRQLRELIVSEDKRSIRLVSTHAIAQIAVPALLSDENIDFKHMRPDQSYAAILRDEADIALVPDNLPWKGVIAREIGSGCYRLYCKEPNIPIKPVLLPEDQMEVLALQQSWQRVYDYQLPIKARIPSWSLIANICANSSEIGFLPDFLARKFHLHPVSWQPAASQYRVLALYRHAGSERLIRLIAKLSAVFTENAY